MPRQLEQRIREAHSLTGAFGRGRSSTSTLERKTSWSSVSIRRTCARPPARILFQTRIIAPALAGFQYDVAHDGRFLINSLARLVSVAAASQTACVEAPAFTDSHFMRLRSRDKRRSLSRHAHGAIARDRLDRTHSRTKGHGPRQRRPHHEGLRRARWPHDGDRRRHLPNTAISIDDS